MKSTEQLVGSFLYFSFDATTCPVIITYIRYYSTVLVCYQPYPLLIGNQHPIELVLISLTNINMLQTNRTKVLLRRGNSSYNRDQIEINLRRL